VYEVRWVVLKITAWKTNVNVSGCFAVCLRDLVTEVLVMLLYVTCLSINNHERNVSLCLCKC